MESNRIQGLHTPQAMPRTVSRPYQNGQSFEALLQEKLQKSEPLSFSKHAKERVAQRGISVSESMMHSLQNAVDKAREKGARDVAVIGQNEAFIVNVPHNVVVTALSDRELSGTVFTNIDSAVLL